MLDHDRPWCATADNFTGEWYECDGRCKVIIFLVTTYNIFDLKN